MERREGRSRRWHFGARHDWGCATRDYTAAMRARAKRSLFTNWTGATGLETGAGARSGDKKVQEEQRMGTGTLRGAPSGGAPRRRRQVSGRTSRPASNQGRFLGLRGVRVQRSRGGKGGGLRQPRIQRGQTDLRVGLGQTNMNSFNGFQRAASKAGIAFHVAVDEIPAGACETGADPTHKGATGTPR